MTEKTSVMVEKFYDLCINPSGDVKYYVNPEFVVSPKEASEEPKIYLLDLKITSNKLGIIKKPVIYFLFENINFLQEVLLKHRINVSHIVKVREGLREGGSKESITVAYAFLSVLNTEYLIIDNETHFNFNLFKKIVRDLGLSNLKAYELIELKPCRQVTTPIKWSDFQVNVFKVLIKEETLTDNRMKEILKPFEERWKDETTPSPNLG